MLDHYPRISSTISTIIECSAPTLSFLHPRDPRDRRSPYRSSGLRPRTARQRTASTAIYSTSRASLDGCAADYPVRPSEVTATFHDLTFRECVCRGMVGVSLSAATP